MPLFYITGTPGSGKSTVLAELKHRDYTVFETDDIAAFYRTDTDERVVAPSTAAGRTPEWRKFHEWRIPAERIETLRTQTTDKIAFLCGVVGNDGDFWDKFDKVYCLYISPRETERRLINRPGDGHGKNAHELAATLEWASYAKRQYEDLGATIIDATQPVEQIADEIIRLVHGR